MKNVVNFFFQQTYTHTHTHSTRLFVSSSFFLFRHVKRLRREREREREAGPVSRPIVTTRRGTKRRPHVASSIKRRSSLRPALRNDGAGQQPKKKPKAKWKRKTSSNHFSIHFLFFLLHLEIFFAFVCVCAIFFSIFFKNISFVLIKIFFSTLGISADLGQFLHFSFFFQYFFRVAFFGFYETQNSISQKKIQKFRNFSKNSTNGQRRRNSLSCRYFLPKIM